MENTIQSTLTKIIDLCKPSTDHIYIKLSIKHNPHKVLLSDITKPEIRPIQKINIPSCCIETHIPYIPTLTAHSNLQTYITEYNLLLELNYSHNPIEVEALCVKSDIIPIQTLFSNDPYIQIARTIKHIKH